MSTGRPRDMGWGLGGGAWADTETPAVRGGRAHAATALGLVPKMGLTPGQPGLGRVAGGITAHFAVLSFPSGVARPT